MSYAIPGEIVHATRARSRARASYTLVVHALERSSTHFVHAIGGVVHAVGGAVHAIGGAVHAVGLGRPRDSARSSTRVPKVGLSNSRIATPAAATVIYWV